MDIVGGCEVTNPKGGLVDQENVKERSQSCGVGKLLEYPSVFHISCKSESKFSNS